MCLNFKIYQKLYFVLIFTVIIFAGIMFFENNGAATETLAKNEGRILILDPGHGGADGGATSVNGVEESEINLAIGLRTAAVCDFLGINYVLTRDSEDILYEEDQSISEKKRFDQRKRVELINSFPNSVLISLHQNFYTHPAPFGPQVFYGKEEGSKELAEIIQENLNVSICPENRRLASDISENIYLMKKAECPSALVECGFISNPKEAELLNDDTYRLKIAVVLIGSYLYWNRIR